MTCIMDTKHTSSILLLLLYFVASVQLRYYILLDVIERVVIYAQVYRFPEFRARGCPGCLQTMHTVL